MDGTLVGIVGILVIFTAMVGFVFFFSKNQRQTNESLLHTLKSVQENAKKTSSKHEIDDGRIPALERRMEMLEDDCKKILARANTRLRRAEKLRGEDDEDTENDVNMPVIYPQIEIPNTQNQVAMSEAQQLQQIRDLGVQSANRS